MIHPDSRTLDWISHVAKENKIKNLTLVEKVIRAFSLLESLARSDCPFIFKGGSSLMLHFDSAKRLSIDVDIICPPGTKIENFLNQYSEEYGFEEVQLVERISRSDVPKQHTKFFYEVAYPIGGRRDKILLDVLFEESYYTDIMELPISSRFLKLYGDPIKVSVPSKEELLGDKLTAFAPHTTGIPFFKGEKDCSMEINKQLFDIASLFDVVTDLSVTRETFHKLGIVELQYRGMDSNNQQVVLDDIYNTAMCIVLRGQINPEEFTLLLNGVGRVRGFIYSEVYTIERAIVNASKAAYLSKLLEKKVMKVEHFSPDQVEALANIDIQVPLPTELNKLKKTNIEAFYYWVKTSELLEHKKEY